MMRVKSMVKKLVKTPLRAMGLDLVRVQKDRFQPRDERKHRWWQPLAIRTVFDIGANEGQFATQVSEILPEARVYSYEPLAEPFAKLSATARPNFRAFRYAIGETNGTIEMHKNEYSPSSSLLPMTDLHRQSFPGPSHARMEKVEMRTLDRIAGQLALERNILVKMDVQGYEDKVIAGGQEILARTKIVIAETSFEALYEGQPLFEDIYRALTCIGFRYIGSMGQLKSVQDGRLLQADSMFLRDGLPSSRVGDRHDR